MFEVVLFEPEIPPNTGNIIRLCANAGSSLHLIHPLGFNLSDKQLRRAGLDYHDLTSVRQYPGLDACLEAVQPRRVFACTTKGSQTYADTLFEPGDMLLFGPESRGLPMDVIDGLPPEQRLRIPMIPGNRSLNLANAVSIILYEAWRQQGFQK